jgi:hypothetical protein
MFTYRKQRDTPASIWHVSGAWNKPLPLGLCCVDEAMTTCRFADRFGNNALFS